MPLAVHFSANAVFLPRIGYDEIVESRIAVLKSVFMRHGADALSAVTIGALIVYPLPFCIDCEYPNPWSHATTKGEALVAFWLLIAPFLAGVLSVKKGWVIPIVVVAALVVTQPVGGVPWWSLRENEGPLIVVLGLPVTGLCFFVGWLTRSIARMVWRQS